MLAQTVSTRTYSLVLSALVLPALIVGSLTEAIGGPLDTQPVSDVAAQLSAGAELSGSVWLPEAVVVAEAPYGSPVALPEVIVTAEAPYGVPVTLPEVVVVAEPFAADVLIAAGR